MKIIISTGQGILTFFESSIALKKRGINISIITGWVPNLLTPNWLLTLFSVLSGHKNLVYGLRKRRPKEFATNEILSCALAEYFFHFLLLMSKVRILSVELALNLGWRFFGYQSRKYLNNADIFHVRSGAGQGGAIEKAKKMGMKVIVDHSIAHPQEIFSQLKKANADKPLEKIINPDSRFNRLLLADCDMADLLLVNSNYVKESFVKYGYDVQKITVVNMGISSHFFNAKTSWEINGSIKVLFMGSFGLRKGGKLIIDATKQLAAMGVDFEMFIVGNIEQGFDVPVWFSEMKNVHMIGHLPIHELRDYFPVCDIFIFPSYVEGAAQSLKIAMSAGMPVITTRQSGGPIQHLENGYLILDDSLDELVDGIVFLSKENALREKIGKNASTTIIAEHTWEKYAEEVISIYKRLVNE